jgi:hypothetical protein
MCGGGRHPAAEDREPLTARETDVAGDADAEPAFHVGLHDLPATDLQADLIGNVVLLQYQVHQAPGGEMARRQNQGVGGQIVQGDLPAPASGWPSGVISDVAKE